MHRVRGTYVCMYSEYSTVPTGERIKRIPLKVLLSFKGKVVNF